MKPLVIALTKGRLEKDAVSMFENIGLDCTELKNKGRKLILEDQKDNIEFILVKANDVLTYVEYGAADIGVVGKDTILEKKRNVYEVCDLKMGCCKFALAAPEGFDINKGYKRKVIATKYPNVARDYFKKMGMDVEIIKIEGSVELAPIMHLSDAIVDIVETGTTLRENGLVVKDDICSISARMVVNIVSMKMREKEIRELISKVQNYVGKRNNLND